MLFKAGHQLIIFDFLYRRHWFRRYFLHWFGLFFDNLLHFVNNFGSLWIFRGGNLHRLAGNNFLGNDSFLNKTTIKALNKFLVFLFFRETVNSFGNFHKSINNSRYALLILLLTPSVQEFTDSIIRVCILQFIHKYLAIFLRLLLLHYYKLFIIILISNLQSAFYDPQPPSS